MWWYERVAHTLDHMFGVGNFFPGKDLGAFRFDRSAVNIRILSLKKFTGADKRAPAAYSGYKGGNLVAQRIPYFRGNTLLMGDNA